MNTQLVKQKLIRGLFTGAGAVASGAVGNYLAGQTDKDLYVGAGEVAVGAAVSVGAEQYLGQQGATVSEAAEFAGYGMQAVGWDEIAESLNFQMGGATQTGARVIDVTANADRGSEQNNSGPDRQVDLRTA